MKNRIPVDFVGSPQHLPRMAKGRIAVLDVAFASGEHFDRVTDPYIQNLGDRLALWCDHHEHPVGWSKYRDDPRFLLVPNREAHACPELITPEVAERTGEVDHLVVHGDFDGVLTAVKLLRKGLPPYPEADEDARAIDSPGRGHALTARGLRTALAIEEAVATLTSGQRRDFLYATLYALVEGVEPDALRMRTDELSRSAQQSQAVVEEIAARSGREELPGVFVVRFDRRVEGRMRKGILRYGEERHPVGVIIETEGGRCWLTAATFDQQIDLSEIDLLDGGRSDFRYAEPKGSVEPILQALKRAVADR